MRRVKGEETLADIEGPLRLSAKYDMAILHTRLAAFIRTCCPLTLKEWDESGLRVWLRERPRVYVPLVNRPPKSLAAGFLAAPGDNAQSLLSVHC